MKISLAVSGCHPTELNHWNPRVSFCSNIWSIDRCLVPSHSCSCVCPPGYEGQQCELNPDDCEDNDCENNSTCVDGVNNYTCVCPPNYKGTCSTSLKQSINAFTLWCNFLSHITLFVCLSRTAMSPFSLCQLHLYPPATTEVAKKTLGNQNNMHVKAGRGQFY